MSDDHSPLRQLVVDVRVLLGLGVMAVAAVLFIFRPTDATRADIEGVYVASAVALFVAGFAPAPPGDR
jgi:hypothetical protein